MVAWLSYPGLDGIGLMKGLNSNNLLPSTELEVPKCRREEPRAQLWFGISAVSP
jgi:hypothetical protein